MSDQSDIQDAASEVEEAVLDEQPEMNDAAESGYENLDLSPDLISILQLLDMVNAQLGTAGALVVSHYQFQKQQADIQMQQQGQYPQQPQPGQQPQQPQYPPIVQDFASLANILTQIQYDLFDITVTLAQQQLPEQIDSRIDEKAIQWMTDISSKISGQLPQHTDPVLPIGNQLATTFYITKTYCQQAASGLANLPDDQNAGVIGQDQSQYHDEYLNQLQSFLFAAFRWSNLILGERDWYWKPKSEMQDQQQSGGQGQQGGGQSNQPPQQQLGQQPMQQQPVMNQQPLQQAPMVNQPQPMQQAGMMNQPMMQQPQMGQTMMNQPVNQQPVTANGMSQPQAGMNGMQQPSGVSGK